MKEGLVSIPPNAPICNHELRERVVVKDITFFSQNLDVSEKVLIFASRKKYKL